MPDETVDPVQPEDVGQGGGDNEAPYAEYLNRIPEEVREQVEPVFKDWDGNVTRRFQEQAQYRDQWKPYEEAGVNRLSPAEAQWSVEFYDALQNNPEGIAGWIREWQQQHPELTPQEAARQQPPPAEEFGTYVDPGIEDVLKQQLGPIQQELQRMSAWRDQQEQSARQAEAERYVESQFNELKAKHKDGFDEDLVKRLVAQYQQTDPRNAVQRAFADSQAIYSQIEKAVLQQKVNQPAPAESGGIADGSPEPVDKQNVLAQAKQRALAQLQGGNRQ